MPKRSFVVLSFLLPFALLGCPKKSGTITSVDASAPITSAIALASAAPSAIASAVATVVASASAAVAAAPSAASSAIAGKTSAPVTSAIASHAKKTFPKCAANQMLVADDDSSPAHCAKSCTKDSECKPGTCGNGFMVDAKTGDVFTGVGKGVPVCVTQ